MHHKRHISIVGGYRRTAEKAGAGQGEAYDAGDDVYGDVKNLEPAGEVRALLTLVEILGCKNGLNHALVRTPEPQAGNGIAKKDGKPVVGGQIVGGTEEMPIVLRNDSRVGKGTDAADERTAAKRHDAHYGERG